MSEATLNTFSAADAHRINRDTSYKIARTIQVPLVSINEIIAQNFVFSDNRGDAVKIPEIAQLMERNGCFAYADTYLNTIFVDRAVWLGQTQ